MAPVPTFRSSLTSVVGGGPTLTGTAGAPWGSGSVTATHGLPAADPAAGVESDVGGAVVEDDDFAFLLLPELPARAKPPSRATITTMVTPPAISRFRRARARAAAAAASAARRLAC